MKRPFAYIGFSMILSLVFAEAFHTAAPYCAAVCFVLFAACIILKKAAHRKTDVYALCCIAACISMLGYTAAVNLYVLPLSREYDGKQTDFSGMIITEPYTSGSTTSFTVQTDTVNGEKKKLKLRISTSKPESAHIYDNIEGEATLTSLFEYGYGYASYYGARSIFYSAYINPYFGSDCNVIHNDRRPFYAVFSDIRKAAANSFDRYLAYDESAVCTAVVTGDRQYLNDDIYDSFRRLGISHILVVSGMHLSVAVGAVRLITRQVTKRRKLSAFFELLCIWTFALITGMGFSVIRAAVMLTISTLAWGLYDKADGLDSLGAAAIILCLNPLNIGDIGLLWSFACTFSILVFAEPLEKHFEKVFKVYKRKNRLNSAIAVSTAASIGSLPFLIFYVGAVSPYMILINIMLMPFTGIMIITAMAGAFLSLLHITFAAKPFLLAAGFTAKGFLAAAKLFGKLPFSNIKTDNEKVYIWFFMSIILIAAFYSMNKKTVRYIVLISILSLAGLYAADIVNSYDTVTVSVLDVGDGIAVTVEKNDRVFLIDAVGEKYQYQQIKDKLSDYDVISCLFDTNYYKYEEYAYYRRILRSINAEKIVVCTNYKQENTYSYSRYLGADVIYADADIADIEAADSLSVTLIRTDKGVWQYIRVYDKSILICPYGGDHELLPSQYKNADYIILGDMPDNISFAGNPCVIISAYGEKCRELSDLMNNGCPVYTTDGRGRLDLKISCRGGVSASQEYTGGVKRYATGE